MVENTSLALIKLCWTTFCLGLCTQAMLIWTCDGMNLCFQFQSDLPSGAVLEELEEDEININEEGEVIEPPPLKTARERKKEKGKHGKHLLLKCSMLTCNIFLFVLYLQNLYRFIWERHSYMLDSKDNNQG